MTQASEQAVFAKAIALGDAPTTLLADRGVWAGVFFDGFRSDDDDEEDENDLGFELFGDASPPGKPALFSFALPDGWRWHVLFHGSNRGGLSHAISKGKKIEVAVQADGHPTSWSWLTFDELRRLSEVVTDEATHSKYFAPLLFGAALPGDDADREDLEAWFASAAAKAGVVAKKRAKAFARALRLTDDEPRTPVRTKLFAKFLDDVL